VKVFRLNSTFSQVPDSHNRISAIFVPKVFANSFLAANPFGFMPQQAICIVHPAQTGL